MLLTTLMVLAPGCRCMFRMTAGVLVHPRRLVVVLHSIHDLATFFSITGAPLR
jgi:hypothetical protein